MARQDGTAVAYQARALVNDGEVDLLFPYKIGSAVIRGNTLSFDWDDERLERHHDHLTTSDGVHFSGTSVPMRGSQESASGTIQAVLYSNKLGHVLIGDWVYGDGSQEVIVVQFYDGRPTLGHSDATNNCKKATPQQRNLPTNEVAKVIGCSVRHARLLIERGKIKSKKVVTPIGVYREVSLDEAIRYRDQPQGRGYPRWRKRK